MCNPEITGKILSTEVIANHLYAPSYVSMSSALRYYGLIPETVYTKQSMTLKHSRDFEMCIRDRKYVENIQKPLALKEKPNSEKRVVIYYYKGPGQSAMSAAGMEVVPSLYNLLKKMKEEGYRVENLPANSKELEKMIMAEGAVFGTYANGVMDRFLKESHPLLISKEEYESWVKQALRPEKYAEVVAAFGEFPGEYMSTALSLIHI